MSKTLVIVESPAKAKTIGRFLGSGYDVQASFGHVRDLPESSDQIPEEVRKQKWARLGVNVEKDYEPIYVVSKDKKDKVAKLKQSAQGCREILLATDEDREGESISWHILQLLKPKKDVKVQRIVFHEITQEAIDAAIRTPRSLDENLVKAQETRRILDRLYGYTLSPLLWKKVAPKLSAGRVQSVAVRLIVQRERERRDFVTADYSGITAKVKGRHGEFEAKLDRIDQAKVADGGSFGSDGALKSKDHYWLRQPEASETAARAEKAEPWMVKSAEKNPGQEFPPAPFMTSTLQQEANRKLGFTARRTMQIAQSLYEGVDLGGERIGLITYMRTDSLTLAERALEQARTVIRDLYGPEYLPAKAKQYKSKAKNAQEAHEAIRPTELTRRPNDVKGSLSAEQFALYDLIWKRTLACQMKPADVERTRVEVTAPDGGRVLTFSASGKAILFPGFLRVYVEGADDPDAELGDRETILPEVTQGEILDCLACRSTDHATKPPARYTEASLVKELEAEGVGRPSTYASIIGTIEDRGYVFKRKKELAPTFTAFAVTELLENHFFELVDTQFTARMEQELDDISEGRRDPVKHLREFYEGAGKREGLVRQIDAKSAEIPFPAMPIGEDIVVRIGRNGPFLQRGEGGPGNTASVPEDLPPADLTVETALELLAKKGSGPAAVGEDPASGRKVFLKSGRFGAYFEVESQEGEAAPKRVTVPPGLDGSSVSQEELEVLLTFPKTLGKDKDGNDVVLAVGRYGAYLSAGERKANVGDWKEGAGLTLEAALEKLDNPGWKSKRAAGGPEPMRTLGALPGIEGEVKILSGRYGPYITNGQANATIPRGKDPMAISPDEAAELLKAKIEAGPAPKKKGRAPARKPSSKSAGRRKS